MLPLQQEGLQERKECCLGYSAGSALGGFHQLQNQLTKDDVVVIVFHDHGSRYIGKIYNDDWMRERGFLDVDLKVKDILAKKLNKTFIAANENDSLKKVLALMKENDISQLPVIDGDNITGSLTESRILEHILANPLQNSDANAKEIMDGPFSEVQLDMPVKELNRFITKNHQAVLVKDSLGSLHIVTQYDIIQAL